MDQRGRGGGGGGGRGGGGGGGGGNSSRTDLLAAGRKKLQQFRKKKDKREPGKKAAEADADAEAEEGPAKAEEPVPEPRSPVGLKFLAGEGGSTLFEEAEGSQAEQCNGEGPGTVESSSMENADAVQEQEMAADSSDAHNVGTSEQGSSEQRESGTADGEDLPIPSTSGDDLVGARLGEVHVDSNLPDTIMKDNMELNTSSQRDGADDDSNQLGKQQPVEMDPVDRPTSSGFGKVTEVPIPSQDIGADENNDEGAQEMVMDVSGRPLDGDVQLDVEPAVSAEIVSATALEEELTVTASNEIPESPVGRGTAEETDGVDREAVEENPSATHVTDEAVTTNDLSLQAKPTGPVDTPLCELNSDPALFRSVVLQGIVPDHFEDIQRHLYHVTLSRDFLQLQLDEAAGLYSAVTQQSSDETTKFQLLLKETEETKLAVSKELHQCRHELSEVITVKGELELTMASLKEEINTSNLRCAHLETELHSSKENSQQIQSELVDSRLLLEALQKENLELTASLAFEKEAKRTVEEQRDHLLQSLQEKLEAAQIDNAQLNSSLVELRKANCVAQEGSEQAFEIMKKLYDSLQEVLCDSLRSSDQLGTGYSAEEPIERQYGRLIKHLKNLLHEHNSMLSTNADLESRLLSKCEEVEELNMRCSSLTKNLNDVCILNEELKSASLSKNATQDELRSRCLALAEKLISHSANHSSVIVQLTSDSDEGFSKEDHILNTILPCIEEGVTSCIENFENAAEEICLSKTCLQEINIFNQISFDKWSYPLPTLIKEEILPKLCDLQDRFDQLNVLNIQLETEIPVFRDGMEKLDEALKTSRTELQKKVSELEQLDQKLSSVKEKLSIAVAKGKGLIVQRDSLKQSLLEKSGEVEKLTQELQLKETLLNELEAKLKSYTEADRIEALESELSYIRNSATALRDSFLLKDSVLQRIEEVLEDLDLPEQFHSRDIVEKIELLSKMAVGTSFTLPVGDKRSSVDGHSESSLAMDAINDEQNSYSNPASDELKSRYEELHRRFYELAEHNNMLEQSLVERNSVIQKWEEVLGQISTPPQFRMLEAEDKIAWLGNRLLEVEQERDSLQMKIEHLEDSSEMLIADLEESHKRISELSAEVVAIKAEKDFFSQSLEKLRFEFLGLSEKAVQDEFVRDNLRKDLSELQEKLADKSEENRHYHEMDIEIHKLLNLVQNTLQDGSNSEISSGDMSAILCLGKLVTKLLDDYGTLLSKSTEGNFADRDVQLEDIKPSNNASTSNTCTSDKEIELNSLNSELDHARNNLALVEQQRDEAMEKMQSQMLEIETLHAQINKLHESDAEQMQKYQSLALELESVGKQRDNLQEQLTQEEQKCTSLREKLNVAVRKGKGLVQHRDSLKQTMEEMSAVIEKLKDERKQHIESLETEKSSLMDRLAENEKSLHETNQYLSGLLNALNKVDVAQEFDMDPITKVEKIAKFCLDLQETVVSSQNEVKKSKRATELLLAELNEAHERADNLQEELVKAEAVLSESSKQYSVTESARANAVHHLEHIMHVQSQTRRKQVDHLMELNSTSSQLREVCYELSHHLVNAFSKDVDLICYMENFMKASGKWMDDTNMMDVPIASKHVLSNRINNKAHIPNAPLEIKMDDTDERHILHHLAIACHALSDCVKDCNDIKRSIDEHGFSVEQKATELLDVMSNLQSRLTSQHNELESLRAKVVELQSELKERDEEIVSARRNMSLLYEACTSSVAEIEGMTDMYPGNWTYAVEHSAYECIKSIVEQLVLAIKTSQNSKEGSTGELKATVLELQQELQAKDIQISAISSELSYQLRVAESSAKQHSVELEDARMEVHNLAKKVDMLHNQNKALETQVNELKNMESVASEQHGRIKELTDELSRKDQEIEGLMQALDEEEKELEVMENKSHELEQLVQEKEFALKSAEISRTKALAKLATTVDKFDELHSLSENLLAEVENLQSQLQERDSEISFLRQEVTRSTNELLTTEESNKKYSSQINDFIKWLETALLQFGVHCDCDGSQVSAYMNMLGKKIGSLITESDDLRVIVQSKDSLLQVERTKMEELMRKSDALEASLSQKDSQIGLLRRDRASSQLSRSINLPGTSEIEQMNDKVSPSVVTQLRGARKVNNDQVAIDVEMDKDKPLDDEDDDKAHGFKSLTMSHFVPKFTRPISDRIDGMWVSGDRLLMRQPTLRLGVLIYWIALHALLASFI
ncbi:golgin subfamily A member 4-like isoform X2 [Panicum virgatum]|uniref:golgin subfamily A member 4-like isoform X2 n=1 Tax=Panicum virgatum TaxID=38727 RepID=UPI0019D563B0|nr:golgin subfamily A member 4-like isoform X2 [Panicum virgatum]